MVSVCPFLWEHSITDRGAYGPLVGPPSHKAAEQEEEEEEVGQVTVYRLTIGQISKTMRGIVESTRNRKDASVQ